MFITKLNLYVYYYHRGRLNTTTNRLMGDDDDDDAIELNKQSLYMYYAVYIHTG